MNIKISNHNNKLSGAIAVAYAFVANKIGGDMVKHATRSQWGELVALVVGSIGDATGEDAMVLCEATVSDVKTQIRGKSVAEALAAAGYGGLDQIVKDENGKDVAPKAVSNVLRARMGKSWSFNRALDTCITTLDVYRSQLVAALKAGVTLTEFMTQRDVKEAAAAAMLASLSEDARAEVLAGAEVDKAAIEVGRDFTAIYKSGSGAQLEILNGCRAVILGFHDAETVLQDAFLQSLAGFAEKFKEAHAIAQLSRNIEAKPTADIQLADITVDSEDEEVSQAA